MEFVNCFSSHIICSAERPTGVPGKRSHRGSRKRGSNPYAERGLDQFAVLSAELEAKRKKLVAQLGTQLSVVRFAIGSDHRDWIPVIICPTLSKAEIRTLERTATRLIAEDKHAIGSTNTTQHSHTPGVSVRESNIVEEHDHDDRSARVSVVRADDAQNGTLSYLLKASERCLWMVAFIFSIAADIINNVFLSKWHAIEVPPQRSIPSSTRRLKQEGDNPSSSNMSSSLNLSSLPRIRAPASGSAKAVKVTTPSHSTAHAAAPAKLHNRHKSAGFSTAPSTPRDSREAKKSFQASISFPATAHRQDEAPHSGVTKSSNFSKSLSLPKVSRSQEHAAHRSRTTSKARQAAQERERKERSERLGQALTGAWLALGLGSLVMGYIPAILCVACWWYALPSLRKAVGVDKPHVKSHHR